ncbi:MAG: endonuclease III [Defluviitaleaceae bacterium]|nr:endonuclease III [Defluviitaleaceae bacterium]
MINKLLTTLDDLYPFDGKCFLNYSTPWQLLFATILSAQCTDDRVNIVTAQLFADFPTLEAYATANISDLEAAVKQTGFYRNKARHLQTTARLLLSQHGGEVPSDIAALTSFSGVGRKTANVVRGHIFGIPSIVVDTHVKRVSFRLGLTQHECPEKIEYELMEKLPQTHWIRYNQQVITHGRQICKAPRPLCSECKLQNLCKSVKIL